MQVHGENTIITWFLTPPGLAYGTPVVFSAKYAQIPVEETKNDSFETGTFVVGIVIGIAVTAVAVFIILKSNLLKKEKTSVAEFTQMLLTTDEILLLKTVEEKDGRLAQQELETITGYSKSKVSRHLSLLEEKKLITRERFGRTNIVHLTEDARKYLTSGIKTKDEVE